MKRGTTEAMREAGEHLIVGHSLLDESTRKVAPELNITLPNRASPQQQQFVATVVGSTGKQFDTNAANIMRVTHGQIFPAIAKIRATTKNTLVRQLADQANDVVLDHITVLEKTGLVNFDQANFQQTSPPKLPKAELTPPAPQPGEPVTALTAPPAWRTSTRTFRHSTRRRGDRTGGRGGSSARPRRTRRLCGAGVQMTTHQRQRRYGADAMGGAGTRDRHCGDDLGSGACGNTEGPRCW